MNIKILLTVVIIAILSDVVSNNSIIEIIKNQKMISILGLTSAMLIIQIITAPMQSSISDHYCRRKSLIVAILASFVSLLFLLFVPLLPFYFPFVFLCIGVFTNAFLGNITPLAWSTLASEKKASSNLRFFFGLTTSSYAIGYMILSLDEYLSLQKMNEMFWTCRDIISPLIIAAFSIAIVWKYYRDTEDKKEKQPFFHIAKIELGFLRKEIKKRTTCLGVLAYCCWAFSQYSSLLIFLGSQQLASSIVIMMFGYLSGVFLLFFLKRIPDQTVVRYAFLITLVGYSLFFILQFFFGKQYIAISLSFFLYSIANSFLTSSIFCLFSKERKDHELGKGFGLIVSSDSAGFLFAEIVSITFKSFASNHVNYVVVFTLLIFILSWIPYSIYEKIRKEICVTSPLKN